MNRSKDGAQKNWSPYQPAPLNEYRPTILDSGILVERLATEIKFFHHEFRNFWREFKRSPGSACVRLSSDLSGAARRILFATNMMSSFLTALFLVSAVVLLAIMIDKRGVTTAIPKTLGDDMDAGVQLIDLKKMEALVGRDRSGMGSNGRAGYNQGRGEGSNSERKRSQGGGSGGNNNPTEAQRGKPPAPSTILAEIPKTPPLHPAALPEAGIDLDPALWRDLKLPVYGNPQSRSEIPSNGPGTGGGMGNNRGLGVGTGDGPGVGPGSDGNTGGGPKQIGCCGPSGGSDEPGRVFPPREVEQRVRVLAKPEPNYTDEARKNQITGTVVLRVIFTSLGQVEQIRTVQQLPFGLTERAIAAARQIRFLPAMRGGRPVSVYMQLEYNFNLY